MILCFCTVDVSTVDVSTVDVSTVDVGTVQQCRVGVGQHRQAVQPTDGLGCDHGATTEAVASAARYPPWRTHLPSGVSHYDTAGIRRREPRLLGTTQQPEVLAVVAPPETPPPVPCGQTHRHRVLRTSDPPDRPHRGALAGDVDLTHEQFGGIPRHVRVVPLQPRQVPTVG